MTAITGRMFAGVLRRRRNYGEFQGGRRVDIRGDLSRPGRAVSRNVEGTLAIKYDLSLGAGPQAQREIKRSSGDRSLGKQRGRRGGYHTAKSVLYVQRTGWLSNGYSPCGGGTPRCFSRGIRCRKTEREARSGYTSVSEKGRKDHRRARDPICLEGLGYVTGKHCLHCGFRTGLRPG